ncbi:protein kinase domain-containing protein [Acanthopleuribacter pedis]|uniref:Tetratricopeptide repeat protein n=1 Tax=Acanthopleuribacter pedis TaxID=442870 RepID=A0A8J7Q7K9_9BACT|nr:tetratricopeptide repeat protein [Acanthopleuribacter pedis]
METISVTLNDHPSYPPLSSVHLLQPGDVCGPYRVERLIGQGGMAAVYLAERADEIQRKVALKVLSHWTPKRNDLFQSECRILAGLEHPGIARLYDAGTHVQGQPWMAMEFIQGESLDVYLRRVAPDLDQRLLIFVGLGDALSHAHQQMIIHRDLKPTNILVTKDGVPKLLDFGIASTLDPGTGEQEGLTQVNERIMTPQYASPEQVNGKRLSAASDVYSLGLILYEMVTGRKAYLLEGRGVAEILDIVNNEPITKPSEHSTDAQGKRLHYVARLRGDLDTIILKALAREPNARYSSVEALVADVRAYLAGLPIQARPASRRYRLRKFLARNPWPTCSVGVLVVLMIGFSWYARVQNQRVTAQRDVALQEQRTAEAVTQFMIGLFERVDPNVTKGKDIRASDLLESGMFHIAEDLDEEPRVRLALLQTMARVHASLGEYRRAADLFEQARALAGEDPDAFTDLSKRLLEALIKNGTYAEAHRELSESEQWYRLRGLAIPHPLIKLSGDTCVESGRFVEAAKAYDQVWAVPDLSAEETVALTFAQARLYETWGFSNRSITLYEQVVAAKKKRYGPLHSEVADSIFALANCHGHLGRFHEAGALFAEAAGILETLYSPNHIRYAQVLQAQAFNAFRLEQTARSEALFQQAFAIYEGLNDPNHPEYAMCINKQGILLRDQGDHVGAEKAYRRALAMFQQSYGDSHPNTLSAQYNLALSYRSQGRKADCDRLLVDGLTKAGRALGEHHPLFATYLYSTAVNHDRADRTGAALEVGRRVEAIRRRSLGTQHPRTIGTIAFVSRRLSELERFPEALDAAREAAELSENHVDVKSEHEWRYKRRYALYLAKTGLLQEALTVQAEINEDVRLKKPNDYRQYYLNERNRAEIHQWCHQWDEAVAIHEAFLEKIIAHRGLDHRETSRTRMQLAYSLRKAKRWADAEPYFLAETAYQKKKQGYRSRAHATRLFNHGLMRLDEGRFAEAEQMMAEAHTIHRGLGRSEKEINGLRASLAVARLFQESTSAAGASELAAAVIDAEQRFGTRSMAFANWLYWRVEKLVENGFYEIAQPLAKRLLTLYQQQERVPTYRVVAVHALLGVIAAARGDAAVARQAFDEADQHLARDFGGPDHWLGGVIDGYRQEAVTLLGGKKDVL